MNKSFLLLSLGLMLCSLLTFGQMPTSPCSPSGGKKADILGVEAKYRAPGGAAPVFTIPAGTTSINVYVSSETGIPTGGDNAQGDEDFINISAVIDISGGTSSGYVNYARNTNIDGTGTNVYGWQKAPLGSFIPTASKIGDATPDLNNINFSIAGNTLTIIESTTTIHSSYYVEFASPYNNSVNPLDPQVRALLHGTGTASTDLVIPIPTGANLISIQGKGTNSSYADLNTSSGTEEGYSNLRFTIDLDAGLTDGVVTLANGGSVDRRSTYVINNLSSASTMSFLSSAAITGDYNSKLGTAGAVGVYNPQMYVSGTNLVIRRDANYARDFDDAYVVEFYHRVGQGMSAEFINTDFAFIAKGFSAAAGVTRTFTIPLGTNAMYLNESGNSCNSNVESNENSLASYAYIDLTTGTATGYFYQQVGLDKTTRRDDNFAFKGVPLNGASARNHANTVGFKGPYNYDISFTLSADKTTLTVTNRTGLANPDYQILLAMDYFGARPDIAFSSSNITFAKGTSCDMIRANVQVCNPGAGNAAGGMPVSFYHGDPTTDPTAVLIYSGTFNQDILQGECKTFPFDLNMSAFSNLDFDLTMIVNDNGSFVSGGVGTAVGTPFTLASLANQNTGYKECYYDNNLITKSVDVNNCPRVNLDPDNSSGATGQYNYLNYFNAGSAGARITDTDLSIVDQDGDNMARATVTLTNRLDGASEGLYINGTLPTGITATGSGTGTIILSGSATQAAYIAALGMIEYRNANAAPTTTNRIITTTLYDGIETGPASTTTIVILTNPRINVTGNGTLINDNSGTVNTVDGTDFGTVTTGTVTHTFVINNVGTGVINLTGTPAVSISGDAGFTVTAQPSSTSIAAGSNGNFTVTFNTASHLVGTYTAVVRILNNDADTGRADYSYTVMATVNNIPVVSNSTVTGNEDVTLNFTAAHFTANYSDIDGTPLNRIRIVTLPLNGSFRLNGVVITVGQEIPAAQLGNITFIPTANWNGSTNFDWRGSDGISYSTAAARMTIVITPVNDAPVITVPTSIAVTEDIPASMKDISFADIDAGTGSVTVRFTVPQGTMNAVSSAGVTVSGTGSALILNGTIADINAFLVANKLTYSSTQNPSASVVLTVNINDNGNTGTGGAMQDTKTVVLGITAVNDAPVAVDDAYTTNEDVPLTGNVLTNDTDVEGNTLSAVVLVQPVHGTIVLNTNGSFTYTPALNYYGPDSLSYRVCDNGVPSMCDTGMVRISITAVNDAPVGVGDAYTTDEDVAVSGNVLGNDTDVEGDALTATLLDGPVHGNVTLAADGSFTYTPDLNFNGLDSLHYIVCDNGTPSLCDTATVIFTVNAVNDAPVGVADAYTTDEDVALSGNVLANDTDVEGDALTVSLLDGPVNGNVTLAPDGSFTYTPNANFNGLDSLHYIVCDNGTPSMCDTVTVIFTVNPVNDAPVGVADAYTTDEDVTVSGNVLTNDTDIEGDALTATLLDGPVNGNVTLAPDGSFTYTPNANFNGLDSLHYIVCDNGTPSMCDTATVIFTVNAVNDAPVGVSDAYTTDEDVAVSGNVLTNDTDIEGDALIATLLDGPVNGNVTLAPDGSFTYTPNANFNGLDSLHYIVCDNGTPSMCDTVTVIFTVNAVNDAPVGVADAYTTDEDVAVSGNVLTNDTDIEGDALTATLLDGPVNGNVTLDPDGSFTYTPNANFNGLDSLHYIVCDNGTPSMCDTATVIFTVNAVNDAPVGVADAYTTDEDVAVSGNVLTNDTDIEGDALTATLLDGPVNGNVTLAPDGSFTYTPNANFNGLDSLHYIVCDNGTPSMCDTATVIFTVNPVNDAPVGVADAYTTDEDVAVSGNVLTNDTDIEGDALTATLLDGPVNGNVTLAPDGSFTYTPNTNFNGLDSLHYIVCDNGTPSMCDSVTVIFTVNPVNDAPVGVADAYTTDEDVAVSGNVLTNDTDIEGNALTATLLDSPVNGNVTLAPDGSFTYTPNANFNGLDSLHYIVCDNGTPSMCDTVTVIFTVNPVNDAPVGVADAYTTDEDVAVSGNVLTNDTDIEGDALTATLLDGPVNGNVTLAPDGSFTYTPNTNFNGLDSLHYIVCDNGTPSMCDTATVIFTVNAVNDAPVGVADAYTTDEDTPVSGNVLTNDTDIEGNALTATLLDSPVNGNVTLAPDGIFTYTPNANFSGLDSLHYIVCDNGTPSMCDTATVIFTVNPVNDAPVGVADAYTTDEDVAVSGNVLTNDNDLEGDALTATLLDGPVNGNVTLAPDGSFTYTPNANFNGLDSLHYIVCDNGTPSMCDTVTVIFTVNPVNDAPVGVADAYTTDEDTPVSGNVLTNDTDIEGNALTATLLDSPVNGNVTLAPDGSFTYTPNANFNGLDSLHYIVCDNGTPSMCDTVTVIFTVNPVNDAPVGVADAYTTDEDTPVSGNVLTNDTDIEGNALTATLLDGPVNGNVTLAPDGSFTYTPNANFNGLDSLHYIVCDNGTPSMCDTATVIFTVNPVNDAPVGLADAYTTDEDTPVSGNVLTNDTDIEGDALTATLLDGPANGNITLAPDGSFTYTPNANFNGLDSLHYIVCDNGTPSMCDTATVIFTVNPVNDAPVGVADAYTTDEDIPVSGNVLTNDTDIEGDALTATLLNGPVNGNIILDPNGTFTYTPNANFNGLDSLHYIVCDNGTPSMCDTVTVIFTVNPVNDAPTAGSTQLNVSTPEDTPYNGVVIGYDADGDALTYGPGTQPAHGQLVVNADGTYTYTPDPDYNGQDTYTIIITDAHGASTTVTITIDVIAVNDAPTSTNQTFTTPQNTVLNGTITATDIDGDVLNFAATTNATNGVVVVNPDGTFVYTPNNGYYGPDSFTVEITDGHGGAITVTITINVIQVITHPAITLVKQAVLDGNTITYTFTVTNTGDVALSNIILGDPMVNLNTTLKTGLLPGEVISQTITYTLTQADRENGSVTNTATVSGAAPDNVTVSDISGTTATNDTPTSITVPSAPRANDDESDTRVNIPVMIPILDNDDPVNSTFVLSMVYIITQPQHGQVIVNEDGTVTYTPEKGYDGDDAFTYQVTDADGYVTNIATVTIHIKLTTVKFPTLFTPNGDGKNDVLEIGGLENYTENELIIVNRWGNEVYRQRNYSNNWSGDGLNEGTYYYLLRVKKPDGTGWEVFKGFTTILRKFKK